MSGKFILNAVAAIGWLIVAVFAYAFIVLFGYFGVGFYGLLLLFICSQVELTSGEVSQHQRSLTMVLFKCLGVGLTVFGFGGFLYFQVG